MFYRTQDVVKCLNRLPDPPPLTQSSMNDSFFATQTVDLCSKFWQGRSKSCSNRDKPRAVRSMWKSTNEYQKQIVDRHRTYSNSSKSPKTGRSGKSIFDI